MNNGDCRSVPIAIIGMGCRFAGDATNPEKLWKMLEEGRSAWSEIPQSRFNLEGWYHPNPENISTTNVRGGHFLAEDLAMFDAAFFGLSAETASTMDPQYRLLLESVYEALENAGIPLEQAAGSNTSVFSGAFFHDYQDGHMRDAENLPRFLMTGNGAAMASNRVSHFFDLQGPSMTVDTGCSTTLTALHQACQGLKTGDADMSIVGGSNLLINPDFFITISTLGMLSPDGKSYAFDSRANGYGRGEGVSSIVLKRLDDAIKSGDPIRAVIRETHLNQDGKTETITSPSPEAQERLIRDCYQKAGIDTRSVQYFEAHGTGTPTGDPIEAGAIGSVFGKERSPEDPLFIGSVKTNLGHTEPTSGLASVIKVAMALERAIIPPSINFETPNKRLLLDEWNLKIPRKCEEWLPGTDGVRRASVNNFGYGGANSHVIMEEWPPRALSNGHHHVNGNGVVHSNGITNGNGYEAAKPDLKLFILSAKDENACVAMASNLRDYLQKLNLAGKEENEFLKNLAYTLGQRRSRFQWTSAYTADSVTGLISALGNEKLKPTRSSGHRPRFGFVFTGQGAQWYAMGRELLERYPIFKASMLEAEGYLKEFGANWSLMEELLRDAKTSRLSETYLGMPLCAALQISLVRLLESWGVTPTAVSSHSSGEIAAAYAVGALSFRSAMAACYSRSEVASGLVTKEGGMLAVGIGADAVEGYLKNLKTGEAKVACLNSPASVTVSGDVSAVEELEEILKEQNVFARRLRVRTAYHSHHMKPLYEPYLKGMKDIGVGKEEQILRPVIYASPTTGTRIDNAAEIGSPEHWAKSMLNPVQFIDAFRNMALNPSTGQSEIDIAIEVGPHAALSGPIGDILILPEFRESKISYLSCLMRDSSAVNTMQMLAGELISKGFPVDINSVNFPLGRTNVSVLRDLPPYPWSHQVRHWSEPRVNRSHRAKPFKHHDLLGSLVKGANTHAPTWRHILRLGELPWLRQHTVQSNIVYPGAGYICMAIEAARQLSLTTDEVILGYRLRDVNIHQAIVIPEDSDGVEVQVVLTPVGNKDIGVKGWRKFQIFSAGLDNKWIEHCDGLVHVVLQNLNDDGGRWSWIGPNTEPAPLRGFSKSIDPGQIYADMRSLGIYHGPVFQNLESVQVADKQSVSIVSIADVASMMPANHQHDHVLHPTTLDSIFVSAYGALLGSESHLTIPKVPKTIKDLWISSDISSRSGHKFSSYTKVLNADSRRFQSAIALIDAEDGDAYRQPVLAMDGFVCQSLGASIPRQVDPYQNDICSILKWGPDLSFMDPDLLKQELNFPVDQKEKEIMLDLRRACFHYMHHALASLTLEDVQQLEWHHKKFYTWMKLYVAQTLHGDLGLESSKWVDDTLEERTRLFSSVSASSVNGELICRVGPQIVAILRGEVTPLELMLEDKLLYKYYRDGLKFDRSTIQISKVVKHLVHKNPRAKILEIGAGTGGTTRLMLDVIGSGKTSGFGPYASEYHFTDVSSGFFADAQEQFRDWSDILTYRKLDIEADPANQGFLPGSYDIIIASQVLHATKRMETTMANVRSLLKPGGKLLMMENTKNQVDMQLTFGLLPGWWLSEEEERKFSPILTASSWDRVLKGAGFSGLDLDVHDCDCEEIYSFSVLMSTAKLEESGNYAPCPILIVTGSASSYRDEVWLKVLQESIVAAVGSLPTVESMDSMDPTGKVCIFVGEMYQSLLQTPSHEEFEAIRSLSLKCKDLLWVTRGGSVECENPALSLSAGFLRSLRQESVGKRYITVDLDSQRPVLGQQDASVITRILISILGHSTTNESPQDFEFAERDGVILIPRLTKDYERNSFISDDSTTQSSEVHSQPFKQPGQLLKLEVGTAGLLETLAFNTVPEDIEDLAPDFIEIEPRAFGVNFRDVMAAMGQLNEQVMGLECSGIITRLGAVAASKGFGIGDRVFALLNGEYSNRVKVPWAVACHIPGDLDFETAASIPMVFATAYISLYDKARLCKGQSILIHAATGGVGQAAIILSQLLGAEVYATAGTPEKRDFITSKYGIPADHVFSSRDTSFVPRLMSMTGGRGVDVILNSLSGQILQESFNCLAPFGHFVEIGKFDLERNSHLEMLPFTRMASFSSIDLLALLRLGSPHVHKALTSCARLIEQKVIGAVDPVTVFTLPDIEKAFRLMQAGKHMGKIVLSVNPQDVVPVLLHKPSSRLRPDASYLIAGGVGGIGRSLARWLLAHGAKNLILVSRSAAAGGRTALFVDELEQAYPGCRIRAIGCDISDESSLSVALQSCAAELPPIRGVVQAAMVLEDSILENMTFENYNAAIRPKVQGTWNLHQLLGEDLDFFIMLSSIAGIIGTASQSNYAAGGAFQDAVARYRVGKGLPAVSIDLGAVKDVGYVAANEAVYERMEKMGHRLLSEQQIMSAFESAILDPCPQVMVGINTAGGPSDAFLARELRFSALRYAKSANNSNGASKNSSGAANLASKLSSTESLNEAATMVMQALVKKLVDIFMISAEEVLASKSMADFGVDSLIAVELRNMLALQAGSEVSIFDIMQSPSLAVLCDKVASTSSYVSVS